VRKRGQRFEETVGGKNAVNRKADIGSASGSHRVGTPFQLMKSRQMGFHIRQEHPARLSKMRLSAVDLEQPNAQLFL
jgi:hypothetical protein